MMKYIFPTCMFSLLCTIAMAQNSFKIHISTTVDAENSKIFINILDNDKRTVLKRDSSIVINQSVNFSGTIPQLSNFVVFYIKAKNFPNRMMVIDAGQNEFILSKFPNKNAINSILDISSLNSNSNQIISSLDSIVEIPINLTPFRQFQIDPQS